jgi:hypothetical protein
LQLRRRHFFTFSATSTSRIMGLSGKKRESPLLSALPVFASMLLRQSRCLKDRSYNESEQQDPASGH